MHKLFFKPKCVLVPWSQAGVSTATPELGPRHRFRPTQVRAETPCGRRRVKHTARPSECFSKLPCTQFPSILPDEAAPRFRPPSRARAALSPEPRADAPKGHLLRPAGGRVSSYFYCGFFFFVFNKQEFDKVLQYNHLIISISPHKIIMPSPKMLNVPP